VFANRTQNEKHQTKRNSMQNDVAKGNTKGNATAPSYNMALIITSIKSNKPSFPITPYIQRLVSLAYFLVWLL